MRKRGSRNAFQKDGSILGGLMLKSDNAPDFGLWAGLLIDPVPIS
jgi:hypothetical protein